MDNSFHPNADSKCLFSQVAAGLHELLPAAAVRHELRLGLHRRERRGQRQLRAGPRHVLRQPRAANKNLNSGCDLENVDPIGTADVDVVARYPYQPVDAPGPAADPVNFTVHNLFKKTLTVYSKGADANGITSNSVAKIVLAHAQDIDGSPLAYELVCWMADKNAAGFRVFAGELPAPTADDPDARSRIDPWQAMLTTSRIRGASAGSARSRIAGGNTAIEVFNSNKTRVDVIAEFVNEGILRDTSRTSARRARSARDHER